MMRRRLIVALELIVAAGAIPAGVSMVLHPTRGGTPPVQQEWLEGSPFNDFLIPGLVLAGIIGLGCIAAAILEMRRLGYAPWVSVACGLVLCGWIAVQVTIVPFNFLQPLFFAVGALIGGLAGLDLKRARDEGSAGRPRMQTRTAGH